MIYDEIRAYEDSDVQKKLQEILGVDQFYKDLSPFFFPNISKFSKRLSINLMKHYLSRRFASIKTIKDFQIVMEPYVSSMISSTTDGFTYSGTENLCSKPTIFVGNHRDIALDPAFLNYVLFHEDLNTSRIAIGDNLLDGSYAEILMRLNKSFIVHRNIKGAKETFKRLSLLSSYINKSIVEDKENIWIAQKEGRANDGNDLTDIAVLKMLYLSSRKLKSLKEWLEEINLTPIVISYEYDPLDLIKARGWGNWEQLTFEENNKRDLAELSLGITGYKGRVHLHICEPSPFFKNLEDLASYIDTQIHKHYKIWPVNHYAAKQVLKKLDTEIIDEQELESFDENFINQRFSKANEKERKEAFKIYNQPLLNKKKDQKF
tara:strand:+ start:4391 stop:5518 length:1128 start_codon:yes stop_codon:yes gene_type:complete